MPPVRRAEPQRGPNHVDAFSSSVSRCLCLRRSVRSLCLRALSHPCREGILSVSDGLTRSWASSVREGQPLESTYC